MCGYIVPILFPESSGTGWRNSMRCYKVGLITLSWSALQSWGRVWSFCSLPSVWMFLWLWTHWLLILGRRWMSSGAWNWKVMRMINQIPYSKGCHVPDSVLDNPPTWESEAGLCPQLFGVWGLGVNWEWLGASFGMVSLPHHVILPRFACSLLRPCSFSYGK